MRIHCMFCVRGYIAIIILLTSSLMNIQKNKHQHIAIMIYSSVSGVSVSKII